MNGREWGAYGGSRYSLTRLLKIVSAFTLGHSVTLLADALYWLTAADLHLSAGPMALSILG